MEKRACAVLIWVLMAATLAACGPSDRAGETTEPDTPGPSTEPSLCQGRIAFIGRSGGEKDLFMINADGSGLINVTNGGGPEQSPSWSPDGARIAFARHVGNSDIYTIRPDGSDLVRLTEQPSNEYSPTWSPDGGQVLFGSTQGFASEIYVVSADGGEAVPLTDSAAHKPEFAWSPDGSRIAFIMLDSYNQGDVFIMAAPDGTGAGGGGASNLTQHPAHDCCVAWAPDGERLLFLSSRNGKGGGLLFSNGPNAYQNTDMPIGATQYTDLSVSSDVVRPLTTVVPEQPRDIYVMDRDGNGLTRLTDAAGYEKDASWSPDGAPGGQRITFVSDRDGNDEIYVLAVPAGSGASSSELVRLTNSPEDEAHPAWSPDGACLALLSYRDNELGLYVMNADGTGLRKLSDNADWGSRPSWSP